MKKYGEIFLTSKTCFTLTCTHCERATENYNEFLKHVLENHIDPLSCDIKIEENLSECENPIVNLQEEAVEFKSENHDIEECVWKNLNTKFDTSCKTDEDNIFSETEVSINPYVDNAISKKYDTPTNKNVIHCKMCNQLYNNLELFEKHKSRNKYGYCPICSVSIADVCSHIRNFHKDYYENGKTLREPVRETKEGQEPEDKNKILPTLGNENKCNLNRINDKDPNIEGSSSEHVSQKPNLQEEATESKSEPESSDEISKGEVGTFNTEIDKNNGDMNFSESEDSSYMCADNMIVENHNPAEQDIMHCPRCDRLYSLEILKRHKERKKCGYCPICSLPKSNVYAHIKRFHRDHYENKKNLVESWLSSKYKKLKNEKTGISLPSKIVNSTSFDQKNDANSVHSACEYCGNLYSPLKLEAHLRTYRCGKCVLCGSIVRNLYKHTMKYHKEYAEEKKLLGEKIFQRVPLSEVSLLMQKQEAQKKTEKQEEFINDKDNIRKVCDYCGKQFSPLKLKNHLKLYRCGKCVLCGLIVGDLYIHMAKNHKEYAVEKKLLNEKLFNRIPLSEAHLLMEKSEGEIVKKTENQWVWDPVNGKNKILSQCVYCGKLFAPLNFEAHLRTYRCGKCILCGSIVTDLYLHMTKNHKEYAEEKKLLKEKLFNRVPLSETDLMMKKSEQETSKGNGNQLKNSSVGYAMKCLYCKKIFKLKTYFIKHMKHHEENNVCKFCKKRFLRAEHLKRHLLIHTGERPYKCKVCSASFKEPTHLKEHSQAKHTEGLNFKCTYENCGKEFKTKKRRKYHENYVHTRKYRRMCTECGLICLNASRLSAHKKRKHTEYDDRQFSCKYCEKKFAFNCDLNEHEMIHAGEKQYFCEICNKGYITKGSFQKHCRSHKKKAAINAEIEKS